MFASFYMAGFECATGINARGEWIDQIEKTQHDRYVDADYALIAAERITTAREAIRWPVVDRRGRYDFRSVAPLLAAAKRHGIELIWDLFHYGYPSDVDLFDAGMPARFAEYCRAAARYVHAHSAGPHFFTPVNEGSYFSWVAGEVGRFAPHQTGRGLELKVALARAALAAIPAIREGCPGARIVNVDPVCHVVAPPGATDDVRAGVRDFNERVVFQFLDILGGRWLPELGGSLEALDVVGINYYATNQWEVGAESTPLRDDDPRRIPFADIVRGVARRYGRPVAVTETGDCDERRSAWLSSIARGAVELLHEGIELSGICLYPILGMPDWHDRTRWLRMGAWDLEGEFGRLTRRRHEPLLTALREAQGALPFHRARRAAGER
jgi:hypothetical protein